MAPEDRTPSGALEIAERIQRAPYGFDFYRAVRVFEAIHKTKARLGMSRRSGDDPIRLGQDPSLEFAPATLMSFRAATNGRPPRLAVSFFGLFGPNGPLPLHLTSYARERLLHHDDWSFARFADVFHHRMISLFYRAWAASQPTTSYDRPEFDTFGSHVGSLLGVGVQALRQRDAMPDEAKLHFAGRLSCQARNASGLRAMVHAFFGVPAVVAEFVGAWLAVPIEERSRLGPARQTATLGASAAIGTRAWSCQHKFRIRLGPVSLDNYEKFLPDGTRVAQLVAIVRNYVGDEFDWDVNLVLKRQDVPTIRLGRQGRLGWTTWLTPRSVDRDADDLVMNLTSRGRRRQAA